MSITNLTYGILQAPTLQKFLSGSGTYFTPAGCLYIRVRMVGGGGGGAGSGTVVTGGTGGSGGATTFGISLLSAFGAQGAVAYSSGPGGNSASLGTAIGTSLLGAGGNSGAGSSAQGGIGGSSPFGGAGPGGLGGIGGGGAAQANTGSGGGGGGGNTSTSVNAGGGGGAGAYIDAIITSPANSYSYSVGTGGSSGTSGTSGQPAGAGAAGIIIVDEYYTFTGATGTSTGGATGLKNYISSVVTSNGTNALSGNFEAGSASSFSLAHSTLSGVSPTSLATAGTSFSSVVASASGNLSFATISTGQLAGTYSSSLVSSAASTAGDMLISNAFFIDNEDKAKVLNFKFYYSVTSGLSSLSLTGTSTNSFAVWIYDVANAAWIQPSATFSAITSGVIDSCTGSFQTSSNGTQYQLALVNINASTGAYAITLDDFQVGPGTVIQGAVITAWQDYTPSSSWAGTHTGKWRRIGDSIEIYFRNVLTATPSGSFLVTSAQLLNGLGVSLDNSKILVSGDSPFVVGEGSALKSGTQIYAGTVRYNSVSFSITGAASGGASGTVTAGLAGDMTSVSPFNFATGDSIGMHLTIPIAGWGAQTSLGGADDARVVAASLFRSGQSVANNTPVIATGFTASLDTHGTSQTDRYVIPTPGYYFVSAVVAMDTSAQNMTGGVSSSSILKSGTFIDTYRMDWSATAFISGAGQLWTFTPSSLVYCVAGDYIQVSSIQQTGFARNIQTRLNVMKMGGNATIQAAESVGLSYSWGAAPLTISAATQTPLTGLTVKDYDSHNFFNPATATATVPTAGKYLIQSSIAFTAGLTSAVSNRISLNGAVTRQAYRSGIGAFETITVSVIKTLNAGDQIQFTAYVQNGGTINADASEVFISIQKVGN